MIPMTGFKPSLNPELVERWPEVYTPMGVTAENLARKLGISRADQDAFAARSHARAAAANERHLLDGELLPDQGDRAGLAGARPR